MYKLGYKINEEWREIYIHEKPMLCKKALKKLLYEILKFSFQNYYYYLWHQSVVLQNRSAQGQDTIMHLINETIDIDLDFYLCRS